MATTQKFQPTALSLLQSKYDLIIIGSGGAGLTCALQAQELGLKPVIFEKMPQIGGNTMRASSGMNACETEVQLKHRVVDSFAEFYAETYQGGGKLNDTELLHYFTRHTALAVNWLADHGVVLDDLTITGGMSKMRTHRPATMAPIGSFLVKQLLQQLQDAAIPIFVDTQVTQLLQNPHGSIHGVTVAMSDGTHQTIQSQAVILATGGFGASQSLVQHYRPDLAHYRTTNQAGATGDGLCLGQSVGAASLQLDYIQVHPTVAQDQPHTYLIGEAVRGEGAILVDAKGQRFVNELDTRKIVSERISALPGHGAYLIFDQNIRQRVKAIEFYDQIGLVQTGATLDALASKIAVPKATLQQTLHVWNQAVSTHEDAAFGRCTGMERAIAKPPFYAIHVAPAIHYTMGGLHIDAQTQVLDTNGHAIAGLFAAGEVTGGLHGNNRIGGNSIAETVVFGRQAGQQAAKYIFEIDPQ